jgi:hypothetical protein
MPLFLSISVSNLLVIPIIKKTFKMEKYRVRKRTEFGLTLLELPSCMQCISHLQSQFNCMSRKSILKNSFIVFVLRQQRISIEDDKSFQGRSLGDIRQC